MKFLFFLLTPLLVIAQSSEVKVTNKTIGSNSYGETSTYKIESRESGVNQKLIDNVSKASPKFINVRDAFSKGFDDSMNNTLSWMKQWSEMAYTNIETKGSSSYFPNTNSKAFKKLKVDLINGFGSINIPINNTVANDPMFLAQKFFKAVNDKNIIVAPNSPYKLTTEYTYRADTGCGGVVVDNLKVAIVDDRNNKQIARILFSQGVFEGKCIDDVIFQSVERLFAKNSAFNLTDYEYEVYSQDLINESSPVSKNQEINDEVKSNAIDELKKLKELLDLGLLTQEEFDSKATELKKIILK